jgi:hypothetical protein
MTRVLPLPAPAKTSSGPSVVATARACGSLSSARLDSSISSAPVGFTYVWLAPPGAGVSHPSEGEERFAS